MPPEKISEDSLLEELERLDSELDSTPRKRDMDELGRYSGEIYTKRFGSWYDALERVGLESDSYPHRISTEDLYSELLRLTDELGRVPEGREMDEEGNYSLSAYVRRFGSWNDAVESAGLGVRPNNTRISNEELLDEIRLMAMAFERPPTSEEMTAVGEYSVSTYVDRFGSWVNAVRDAGLEPARELHSYRRDDLLDELVQVTEELGRAPTRTELNELGEYSIKAYDSTFHSYRSALKAAGVHPSQR